jgi:hypothetical protein
MKSKYIAAITSIIAITVTLFQVYIQNVNKNKELELAHIQSEANYKLAQLHEDRTWKYKITEFMAKYKNDIFSEDLETRRNIQKIMMISFPTHITSKIFSNLAKISNHRDWLSAKDILKRIDQPTVYIQIVKGFPEQIIEPIADTMACGDISYVTNDEYVDSSLTSGDVRYFFEEDKELAQQVLKDFVSMVCGVGYKLKLKLLPLTKNKDRNIKGTIEVWLSPKSAYLVTDKENECYYKEPNI